MLNGVTQNQHVSDSLGGALSSAWGSIDWQHLGEEILGPGEHSVPGHFDTGAISFGPLPTYGYPVSPNNPTIMPVPNSPPLTTVGDKSATGGGTNLLPYLVVGVVGIGLVYVLMRRKR